MGKNDGASTFSSTYAALNDEQKQAVNAIDGPLLVIAGPGTGKTQLLSVRVANILKRTDSNPNNILCLTFTEAAAQNMRDRLRQLIGPGANQVAINTFHGFGAEIIQRFPDFFTNAPLLQPIDELGTFALLREIFSKLPHRDPLSLRVNDEFLHLKSTQALISWCKQAAITPHQLDTLLQANVQFTDRLTPALQSTFSDRPSPKKLPEYTELLSKFRDFQHHAPDNQLAQLASTELANAIEQTDAAGRYAPAITAWRNRWLTQVQPNQWSFIDARRHRVMQALQRVYATYEEQLAMTGQFGYDDMILRPLQAISTHHELRWQLQEQYQYILVDEYQDTNGAQNQLLELLADSEVNEQRPNLMVVGDDDQAIYRFQGARYSIMVDFITRWRDVQTIVLTKNYRSAQSLLDLSRSVITMGSERLENQVKTITKELKADKIQTNAKINLVRVDNPATEAQYIANEMKRLLDNGEQPNDIAVLSPKHRFLQELVPHLLARNIPVKYEKREHLLEQPVIRELIDLARLVVAGAQQNWSKVEGLLPQVLSAPFWSIPAESLWQVSIAAYKSHRNWLEVMHDSTDTNIARVARALETCIALSEHEPLAGMLDILTGNRHLELSSGKHWTVPFKDYYFPSEHITSNSAEYLRLLGQLRSLREHINNYQSTREGLLKDFVAYIDLYHESKLTMLDVSPYTSAENAVQLMTAYKAKGLEWKTVFILSSHEDVWGSRTRNQTYSFSLPANLQWIKPARDSSDDRLRLFYVSLTRAKQNLYLSSYHRKHNGQPAELLGWLDSNDPRMPSLQEVPTSSIEELIVAESTSLGFSQPMPPRHKTVNALKDQIQNYHLSATHLNSFLDITKGGPRAMLYRHILRFPEQTMPSAVFGMAMHDTLHLGHVNANHNQDVDPVSLEQRFKAIINRARLPETEARRLTTRGQEALHGFLSADNRFLQNDKSEYDFSTEKIVLNNAQLTGKVDLIRTEIDGGLLVIDYKTGAALDNWKGRTAYGQIRAHLYQQQLLFYYLMLRQSENFHDCKVSELALQFVEPNDQDIFTYLPYNFSESDVERLEHLIAAVWQRIQALDFPDTSKYSLDLKGILAFENWLLDSHQG